MENISRRIHEQSRCEICLKVTVMRIKLENFFKRRDGGSALNAAGQPSRFQSLRHDAGPQKTLASWLSNKPGQRKPKSSG
jgi:hypothetical protein